MFPQAAEKILYTGIAVEISSRALRIYLYVSLAAL